MRRFILLAAAVLLLAGAAATSATAKPHHVRHHSRAEPEHIAPIPPPALPLVTTATFEQLISNADRPVLVLAVFPNCPPCDSQEAAVAREAKNFTGVSFFKEEGSQLGLSAEHGPYLLVFVPHAGQTIALADFHPAQDDLHTLLTGRVSYALSEAAAARTIVDLQAQLYEKVAPFDDRIAALRQAVTAKFKELDAQEQAINADKAAAVRDLTGQLLQLTQARQGAVGNMGAESTIDSQAAVLQKKIDEQAATFDGKLAQVERDRTRAAQDIIDQGGAIERQRDAATKALRERLDNATKALAALIDADRQAAQHPEK